MRDENGDRRDGPEPRAAVGYKKPPVEHRFKRGCSGNKRGRPKTKISKPGVEHSVRDVEDLMLQEAYRLVSIRDGDDVIQVPTIQAVMRGLAVAAIKGSHRAQVTFKEHAGNREKALDAKAAAF